MDPNSPMVLNGSIHWTEYGIPIRNLWYMLLYAWNETPINNVGILDNIEDAPSLDALLASVLILLVQQRLRIGLGRNYCDEKNLLRGIRGRVNFNDSLKYHSFEKGQAYCEFQQFSLNVPKNQIIRSTIVRLIQTGYFGPDPAKANELRHKLRKVSRDMENIDLVELKLSLIRKQQLGRNDRDYRLMLSICELILRRQIPIDSNGLHNLPAIERDSLIMHSIYERFIANFYRIHLDGWKVTPQKYLYWNQKHPSTHLPSMRPDLVLENESTRRVIVIDTKFTADSLQIDQWGKEIYDSSHLYQLYAYLKTQEHVSEQHRCASGILLYPVVNQNYLSEKIELQSQIIQIECVDLTAPWLEIEQQLIKIIFF
jgi:5-methylcytosine-specific restriction enzyme subunit McrC